MEPIMPGQLPYQIERVTVEFLDTGETITLGTRPRPDSTCHFFDPFIVENDTITLRLHWQDIDQNGNPTLDADFLNNNTGKTRKRLKDKRKEVHHTSSIKDGGRSYCWDFKDCKRSFKVRVAWISSVTENICPNDDASIEIKRSGLLL